MRQKAGNPCRRWIVGFALGLGALAWALRDERARAWVQRHVWKPLYSHGAGFYDALDWLSLGWWPRLQRPALDELPDPPTRVLEVGFGSGRLHAELARRYEMAGLDLAPGMVRHAQKQLARHDLTSDLRQGDVTAIPWPDASFDAVVSTFTFSALPDPQAAMDEMARVVRPGGRVVVVDAGDALDGNRAAWALARLWEAIGDFMRDERPFMRAAGLVDITRRDYGPWHCVHVTVGVRPKENLNAEGHGL